MVHVATMFPDMLPIILHSQPSADPKGVPRGKGYLGPNALRQWLAECAAMKAGGQIAAAAAPETAVVKGEAAAPASADAPGAGAGAKQEGDSDEEGNSSDEDSAGKRRREEEVLPHGKRTKTGVLMQRCLSSMLQLAAQQTIACIAC